MSHLDKADQPGGDPQQIADAYATDAAEASARKDDGAHCYHHQHDDRCGGHYDDCDDDASDDCVHCDCCCDCTACEYAEGDR